MKNIRILKYTLFYNGYMLLIVLGGTLLFPLYMWLLTGFEEKDLSSVMSTMNEYSLFVGLLVAIIAGLTFIPVNTQNLLASGCLRKEAFWGNLIFSVIHPLGVVVIHSLTFVVENGVSWNIKTEIAVFFALLAVTSAADAFGVLILAFGRTVYVIAVFLCIFLGAAVGVFTAMEAEWAYFWLDSNIIVYGICILVFAVAMAVVRRKFKTLEVKV